MSDDITTALRGFAEAQRRAADVSAPDQGVETASLARRVSRRRAVRTGSVVLTTAAVVGAIGVGALLSGSRTPAPPAVPAPTTSSPSPTPTPTPSPTPTPAASAPTAPPTATVGTLRGAQPATPEMLDAAGEGWTLMGYGPLDEQQGARGALYLVSPEGAPYVVATADLEGWSVVDWLPRSHLVVAVAEDASAHVLDLVTGETGPALGFGFRSQFVRDGSSDVLVAGSGAGNSLSRVGADGAVRATTQAFARWYGTESWIQSPDGMRIVVNDARFPNAFLTDGLQMIVLPVPYLGRLDACRAWMWVDDLNVLMECTPGGQTAFELSYPGNELWLVHVGSGTEPRKLAGLPVPERLGGVWRVGDRLVAGSFGPSESVASWWEITDDGVSPLSTGGSPELEVVDVRGPELIATLRPRPSEGALGNASIVAIDPVRGTTRTLLEGDPAPNPALGVSPWRFATPPQTTYGD